MAKEKKLSGKWSQRSLTSASGGRSTLANLEHPHQRHLIAASQTKS
jgi:hypothetical protein